MHKVHPIPMKINSDRGERKKKIESGGSYVNRCTKEITALQYLSKKKKRNSQSVQEFNKQERMVAVECDRLLNTL